MPDAKSTVLVIDDDPDVRASVGRLLRSVGIDVQLFASIPDFFKSDAPNGPTCLVLDVRLPGQSGLDLQRELARTKREIPIIFITGHTDNKPNNECLNVHLSPHVLARTGCGSWAMTIGRRPWHGRPRGLRFNRSRPAY